MPDEESLTFVCDVAFKQYRILMYICKSCIVVSLVVTVISSIDGNTSDNDDGSVSVAAIVGAVVGILLLTFVNCHHDTEL